MTYPPPIAFDDFKPLSPPTLQTSINLCQAEQECSISDLWLHPGQKSAPLTAPHGALAANAGGRYRFAPGAANQDEVRFTLVNADHVASATLEVFSRTGEPALARWSRELSSQDRATGRYRLNDLMTGDGWPNVRDAPYRLDLRITAASGATAVVSLAWIYLDVVAKAIAFSFGVGPSDRDKAVLAGVDPACLTDRGAIGQVRLKSNIFALRSAEWGGVANGETMEWRCDDHAFTRHRDAWGDGPALPLLAEIQVESSTGETVSSPEGTASVVLLWDVADAVREAPDPLSGAGDKGTIQAYLDRYTASGPLGQNCHSDHGGKRASNKPVLAAAIADASNPLGFDVAACQTRVGAAFSKVLEAGKAGVYFRPSRMAGDAYRLSAHFRWSPEGDGARALDANGPLDSDLFTETGIFQVWRQIDLVRRWNLEGAAAENEVRQKLQVQRAAREAYVVEMDDDDFTQTWGGYTQEEKDADKDVSPFGAMARDVAMGKSQLRSLGVVWANELVEIRKRLDRAHLHVAAPDDFPYQVLPGYHDAIRQKAALESDVFKEALDLSQAWERGTDAVHFVDHVTFWKKRVVACGSGSGVKDWANLYFGVGSQALDGQMKLTSGSLFEDDELDVDVFERLYASTVRAWSKKLLAAALDTLVAGAEGAYIVAFSALYGINGITEAPMAYAQPLPSHQGVRTAYVVFPRADNTTAAHELGHCLFLCHARGGKVGDPDAFAHDAAMANCLMGYDDTANDFCGFCALRLRGWDRAPLRR